MYDERLIEQIIALTPIGSPNPFPHYRVALKNMDTGETFGAVQRDLDFDERMFFNEAATMSLAEDLTVIEEDEEGARSQEALDHMLQESLEATALERALNRSLEEALELRARNTTTSNRNVCLYMYICMYV